jgi:hypothetical protein
VRPLALAAAAVLVVALAYAYLTWKERTSRRWAAAEAAAQWEDVHYTAEGRTVVAVRKVARLPSGETRTLGESVVDEVPDGDPDWHRRFSAARQVAYDRAIDLNGRPLLG